MQTMSIQKKWKSKSIKKYSNKLQKVKVIVGFELATRSLQNVQEPARLFSLLT
jgi:hypothetical protein